MLTELVEVLGRGSTFLWALEATEVANALEMRKRYILLQYAVFSECGL